MIRNLTGPGGVAGALCLAIASLAAPALAVQTSTGSYGFDMSFDNAQPSLALHMELPLTAVSYPNRDGGDADAKAWGILRTFATFRAPFGQPNADGSLQPISQYSPLFSLIGTQFGGNGTSHFALPDLRGRVAVGTPEIFVGEVTGSRTSILSVAQLPAHRHAIAGGGFTGYTGSGQPVDNRQASLALHYLVAVNAPFPSQGGNGAAAPTFLGQVVASTSAFTPGGFMAAEGQTLSIAEHTDLFQLIGTTYGGDGQETFALPDLRGRTIIGVGQGNGLTARRLGDTVGANAFTLTDAHMPLHAHAVGNGTGSFPTGGHDVVDNMQASLALNYLIATRGAFPDVFDCCSGIGESVLGEVTAFAGTFAPDGWTPADGRLLQIAQNQALFALLGTTYGGDGVRTFALPDLRGRAIVGTGGGLVLGETFGTEDYVLADAQLPSHAHTMPVPEPQTWATLAAGLVLLWGAGHRRRQ